MVRLDGRAFHTLTKKLDRPYDPDFKNLMLESAKYLVDNIMGCKMAYVQSDEISLLLVDYDKLETEPWFDNVVQKIVSISTSLVTAKFNSMLNDSTIFPEDKRADMKPEFGLFDCRVWNLPREEVCNYFVWRQQDATRNSIQGLGQKEFGHKRMHGKSTSMVQDMLMLEKQINWNDVETYFKRGGCVIRVMDVDRREVKAPTKYVDMESFETIETDTVHTKLQHSFSRLRTAIIPEIPVFSKCRSFVERFVYPEDHTSDEVNRIARDDAATILEITENNSTCSIENIGVLKTKED